MRLAEIVHRVAMLILVEGLFTAGLASAKADAAGGADGSAALGAQKRSFLILARSEQLPPGLEKQVAQAGGVLIATIPEIGVAVAESSDTQFLAKATKIGDIRSVVPNVRPRWISRAEYCSDYLNLTEVSSPPASSDLQWGLQAIHAAQAWATGARGAGARIAVLDDGVYSAHTDLAENLNLELSTSFVPGETYEYSDDDACGHGTHVCGIIASPDNGLGVTGVAPEAELVMVKVLESATGAGSLDWILSGIVYAANVDADVINMSLGAYFLRRGYYFGEYDLEFIGASAVAELAVVMNRATHYASARGAVLIASLGEMGLDRNRDGDGLDLPADAEHVLAISATGPCGLTASPPVLDLPGYALGMYYSDFGQSAVDFSAPGGSYSYACDDVYGMVLSTASRQNTYRWAIGTSMAAAHASGVAALVIGANGGEMDPVQVEAVLRGSADDLGKPGKDEYYGHGRLNAASAVMSSP